MTLTTLTKAKLLEVAAKRIELFKDVPTFGDVWLRDIGEVQRSRRIASLFDSNGQRVPGAAALRRCHEIVDQVCEDEDGTPMFTEADIPALSELASAKLDPLVLALQIFNGNVEKKDEAESSDTSENLQVMAG